MLYNYVIKFKAVCDQTFFAKKNQEEYIDDEDNDEKINVTHKETRTVLEKLKEAVQK